MLARQALLVLVAVAGAMPLASRATSDADPVSKPRAATPAGSPIAADVPVGASSERARPAVVSDASRDCQGRTSAVRDLGVGILRHCATNADWTQSDNGADLDWQAAKEWCAKRGSGWQLPTADEYEQLVDRSGRSMTACGKHTCYLSPSFALTSAVFWAIEEPAPGNAMMMTMIYGNRHPARQTISGGYRALCVRHPEEPSSNSGKSVPGTH